MVPAQDVHEVAAQHALVTHDENSHSYFTSMRQSPRAGAACPALLRSFASMMGTMSLFGNPSHADIDEGPHDVSDHVAQKSARLDPEDNHPRFVPVEGNVHDGPHPFLHLALGRTEGVEVMGAQKVLCRPSHGLEIEGVTDMPADAPAERGPDGAVEDPVMVDLAAGVIPRVKFPGHLAHFLHHDIRGQ